MEKNIKPNIQVLAETIQREKENGYDLNRFTAELEFLGTDLNRKIINLDLFHI